YDAWPLLGENAEISANVELNNEFHFTNDRHLRTQRNEGLPFYEGKMIHQYDAFYARPQFWISYANLNTLPKLIRDQLTTYRVVHRRISNTTNERTLISTI